MADELSPIDAECVRETLASLVPPGDPVHEEVARLLHRGR